MTGFAVSSESSRSRSRSNSSSVIARTGLPSSSQARIFRSESRQRIASLSMAFAALSARCTARSTVSRSASASSVLMMATSDAGSTRPETCTTSGSSKQRTTCAIASTSRMCARNLLPRPSPCEAPATRPAMSTNSTVVGMIFSGFAMRGERGEARVRHRHDADIRIDGAERVVLGRDAGAGQRIEERGLADVRQADDAAADAHYCSAAGGAVWSRFMIFSAPSVRRRGNSATASSIASRIRRSSTALARWST